MAIAIRRTAPNEESPSFVLSLSFNCLLFKVALTVLSVGISGSGVTAAPGDGAGLVVGAVGSCDSVGDVDEVGAGVSNTGSPTGESVGDGVIVGAGDMVGVLVGMTGSAGFRV